MFKCVTSFTHDFTFPRSKLNWVLTGGWLLVTLLVLVRHKHQQLLWLNCSASSYGRMKLFNFFIASIQQTDHQNGLIYWWFSSAIYNFLSTNEVFEHSFQLIRWSAFLAFDGWRMSRLTRRKVLKVAKGVSSSWIDEWWLKSIDD